MRLFLFLSAMLASLAGLAVGERFGTPSLIERPAEAAAAGALAAVAVVMAAHRLLLSARPWMRVHARQSAPAGREPRIVSFWSLRRLE